MHELRYRDHHSGDNRVHQRADGNEHNNQIGGTIWRGGESSRLVISGTDGPAYSLIIGREIKSPPPNDERLCRESVQIGDRKLNENAV